MQKLAASCYVLQAAAANGQTKQHMLSIMQHLRILPAAATICLLLHMPPQIDPKFVEALLPAIVQMDPVWISKVLPAVIAAFPADFIVRLVNAIAPALSRVNPDLLVALLPVVNTISLETWTKLIELLNVFTIPQVWLQCVKQQDFCWKAGCVCPVGAASWHVLLSVHDTSVSTCCCCIDSLAAWHVHTRRCSGVRRCGYARASWTGATSECGQPGLTNQPVAHPVCMPAPTNLCYCCCRCCSWSCWCTCWK